MNSRQFLSSLGVILALGAPNAVLADAVSQSAKIGTPRLGEISADRQYVYQGEQVGWQLRSMQYRFENGRIVHVDDPVGHMSRKADSTRPPQYGDISTDRQYVYMGQETGWELRQMQYRFENGHLVHVDDPVGHMNRTMDKTPLTTAQQTHYESLNRN